MSLDHRPARWYRTTAEDLQQRWQWPLSIVVAGFALLLLIYSTATYETPEERRHRLPMPRLADVSDPELMALLRGTWTIDIDATLADDGFLPNRSDARRRQELEALPERREQGTIGFFGDQAVIHQGDHRWYGYCWLHRPRLQLAEESAPAAWKPLDLPTEAVMALGRAVDHYRTARIRMPAAGRLQIAWAGEVWLSYRPIEKNP